MDSKLNERERERERETCPGHQLTMTSVLPNLYVRMLCPVAPYATFSRCCCCCCRRRRWPGIEFDSISGLFFFSSSSFCCCCCFVLVFVPPTKSPPRSQRGCCCTVIKYHDETRIHAILPARTMLCVSSEARVLEIRQNIPWYDSTQHVLSDQSIRREGENSVRWGERYGEHTKIFMRICNLSINPIQDPPKTTAEGCPTRAFTNPKRETEQSKEDQDVCRREGPRRKREGCQHSNPTRPDSSIYTFA